LTLNEVNVFFQKQKISERVFQKFFVSHVATWVAEAKLQNKCLYECEPPPASQHNII